MSHIQSYWDHTLLVSAKGICSQNSRYNFLQRQPANLCSEAVGVTSKTKSKSHSLDVDSKAFLVVVNKCSMRVFLSPNMADVAVENPRKNSA